VLPPSVKGRLRAIRAHPLLNPTALIEGWRERLGGYPEDPQHEPHLAAAIEWLVRAQDATPDDGISRAFSLAWHPYFGGRGWQPSYPATTGYIIPTLYAAARRLGRAGLGDGGFTDAAARSLRAAAALQAPNGWLPSCCLTDPHQPLLHTLAYAIRGFLEGGRVLDDARLLQTAERAADALLATVRADGWMPGRYRSDWSPAVRWSCLTGQAQMANNWMRLAVITGDPKWLEPVPAVLRFLKRTQNRHGREPGVRGGIKGSWPVGGDYGAYEVLNWAT